MKKILKETTFILVFMSIVIESNGYPFWQQWASPSFLLPPPPPPPLLPFHSNAGSDSRWRPFGFGNRKPSQSHLTNLLPTIERAPEIDPISKWIPFSGRNRDSPREAPKPFGAGQWQNGGGWVPPIPTFDFVPKFDNWAKPFNIFKTPQNSRPSQGNWASRPKGGSEGGLSNIISLIRKPNLKPQENKYSNPETELYQYIPVNTKPNTATVKESEPINQETITATIKVYEPIPLETSTATDKETKTINQETSTATGKETESINQETITATIKVYEPIPLETSTATGKESEPINQETITATIKIYEPIPLETSTATGKETEPIAQETSTEAGKEENTTVKSETKEEIKKETTESSTESKTENITTEAEDTETTTAKNESETESTEKPVNTNVD